jgi:hypothetical protein
MSLSRKHLIFTCLPEQVLFYFSAFLPISYCMKHFSSFLLGLSMLLALAGCGKKSDPTPATPALSAKTTLLTTPKWRITAIVGTTTFAGQTTTADGFTNQPSCVKDNFSKFNSDLTATYDEGATKCSTSAAQTKQGTWSFNAAEDQITVVDPSVPAGSVGNTITADLLQLTATTLQIKTTNTQTVAGYTIVSTATTTYAAF